MHQLINDTDPNAPAIIDGDSGKVYSYQLLISKKEELTEKLNKFPQGLAICFCQNDMASICSYLSLFDSHHTVALIDSKINPELRKIILDQYQPDYFLASDNLESIESITKKSPIYSADEFNLNFYIHSENPKTINPENKLLLSTSGTTGTPKFVRLSKNAVISNANSISNSLATHPNEKAILSLPLHYSYGLSVLNGHLISGGSVVLTKSGLVERNFWEVAKNHQITSMAGVPYSYEMIRKFRLFKMFPPSLKVLTQAGGKLSPENIEFFHGIMKEMDGNFYVMYGQTEATARITIMPPEQLEAYFDFVGEAIKDGKITIKKDGHECGVNETGEVFYSGPNVMLGHALEREDLKKGDELAGTLATGDLGLLNEKGLLKIVGRLKRFSKISGLRINLDDLNTHLSELQPIAIIGNDEKIHLISERKEENYEKWQKHLSDLYGLHYQTFIFHHLESIPLLANNKVDYKTLEQRYL